LVDQLDRLDLLVNNAGTNIRKKALEYSSDEYAFVRETNMDSVFEICRLAQPLLATAGDSSIVNIVSVAAFRHLGTGIPYAMTKAAISHMTRGLAAEWAKDGIRVNAVAPSLAMHPFLEKVMDPAELEHLVTLEAFGRSAETWEVANVIVFLASDYSSYMTGEVVSVSSQHP
jgi:NAD(P)-dependent dehydrogenase (short-subunit alcohol dehydrogenase family)